MSDHDKTKDQLLAENEELRRRVAALEGVDLERRRADEELAKSKAILTAAVECLPFDFFALDPEGRCILQNAVSRQHYGEALGKMAEQVCPDERILPRWIEGSRRALGGEKVEREGAWWVRGEERHFCSFLAPIQDDGKVYGVLGVNVDITESKRAEEALRQSEGRYRALAESTRDIIFILDRQGTLLYANQAASQCIGIPPGDIVGKRQVDLFPPEMARSQIEKIGRVFTSGDMIAYDDLFHFGPEAVWLRIHLIPLRDEGGQITSVMGVCHNITDQKRAEEALREREARLLEAQEIANLGFTVVDLITGRIKTSTVLDRLCGISVDYEKTLGKWADLVHPDERQEMLDYLKEVVGERKPFDREYRIVRYGDKQVRWFHGLGQLQFNKDGQPVSMLGIIRDITERKQAERELAKHRAMLQAAIDCLPFNFFAIGLDGRYMLQNAMSKAQQGADVLGKRPEEVCPNEHDLAIWAENNRRAFAGEKVEGEVTLSLTGGERSYYNVVAPISDGTELYGILGVNIDITERKRAEEALRKAHDELEEKVRERTAELSKVNEHLKREVEERRLAEEALRQSERRFRNYFEQGLIGMAVTSVDKRWLEVNDRLCEILGYSREELLRSNWAELTYPEDLEPNIQLFNRLLAGEIEHFTLDKRFVRKDRSIVYTTIHIRAFRKEDGTIDHIVALFEDITARKQAEKALLESERRVRTICDSALDAVIMIDASGKALYWNPATERMFGYSSHEMMGCDVHAMLTPARYREDAINGFSEFATTGQGRAVGNVMELTALRKDGTEFPVEISVAAFKMSNQRYATAIIRDVTERHMAQEALERERQTLWQMLQASDHERQTISYEIHDGLAQYLAAAGMQFQVFDGLRESNPEEAVKAYDAATQLVRQSHAEARRLVSEVRAPITDEIGLETAISHLVHEQRRRGGPEIEYHSSVQFGRLPAILESALYRIAQEALTNACKYSKSRKVTVTMTQEAQLVRLEVRDWGLGFDPKSVEKGHFGLEGIRQRVRLLGGRLTIESTPGSGTLLQVVVPILERPSEE